MHGLGCQRAAAIAAGLLPGPAPTSASAASGPIAVDTGDSRCTTAGSLCVFETEWFTGHTALYQDVDTECVTAPFGILANINMTDRPVTFRKNADCTGFSTTEPAGTSTPGSPSAPCTASAPDRPHAPLAARFGRPIPRPLAAARSGTPPGVGEGAGRHQGSAPSRSK
ncbi:MULTISPECIES: hypothetical protein [unclassified Streptomyces]|uniref:hypothetical protein n=1 Tax=unclassified Streptomyces TaxID=2593676 RepID=UPI0003744334|nr:MULTISPECIES: hypothetical protein [unclassified Streptomyces]MYX33311.1 hypothetical protein [Streptomyces sp. SID8377]